MVNFYIGQKEQLKAMKEVKWTGKKPSPVKQFGHDNNGLSLKNTYSLGDKLNGLLPKPFWLNRRIPRASSRGRGSARTRRPDRMSVSVCVRPWLIDLFPLHGPCAVRVHPCGSEDRNKRHIIHFVYSSGTRRMPFFYSRPTGMMYKGVSCPERPTIAFTSSS